VVNTSVPLVELSRANVVLADKAAAAVLVSDQVVGLAGSNGLVSDGTRGGTNGSGLLGGELLSGVLLSSLLGGLLLSDKLLLGALLGGLLAARTLDAVLATNIKVVAVVARTPVETVVKANEGGYGDLVVLGNGFAAITLLDGVEFLASSNGSAVSRDGGGSECDGGSDDGEFHDLKDWNGDLKV
jgi:hypothetical protein